MTPLSILVLFAIGCAPTTEWVREKHPQRDVLIVEYSVISNANPPMRHGPYRKFFPDGSLRAEGQYDRGARQGRWTSYYPDGQVRKVSVYHAGKDDGEWFAYRNDGQLTKREVRAATLAALAPVPGQLLWDVGAGAGSVAIEWMRTHPTCAAIAVERDPDRAQTIFDNATALGTPRLDVISGEAPAALDGLATPHAVFVGGGATTEGLIEACWRALPANGRLVANAITVEGESALYHWREETGGELVRIAVSRALPNAR